MIDNIRRKSYKISFLVVAVIPSIIYLNFSLVDRTPEDRTYPGFDIKNYSVYLDVQEDNRVYVTEKIGVNFTVSGKHGMLRFIPHWLEYTDKNGKTHKRKANIYNLSSDEQYTIDVVNKKERIKIGDPNYVLTTGYKVYTINYEYDMGADPYKGFDEFIFHAFGDYWNTVIENPEVIIKLPKNLSSDKINFFADKYRKENVNDKVTTRVIDDTIYAKYNGTLDKSLTVDIELPDGYFVGGSDNYGTGSLSISMGIIIMTLIIILMWYFCGKDYKKKSQMVEFYPPDNINAAELGYIYGNYTESVKLPISLIVQLAAKEYIKIIDLDTEPDNSKKISSDPDDNELETGIKLINLVPKPISLNNVDDTRLINQRIIKIKKLKQPGDDLSLDEIFAFNKYFSNKKTVTLTTDIEDFLKIKDKLVDHGYIEILLDNKDKLVADTNTVTSDENFNKEIAIYNEKISKLEPLSELEQYIYDSLFEPGQTEVVLNKHKTLYSAFIEANARIIKKYSDKIVERGSYVCTILAIIMDIAILLLSVRSYKVVEDLNPSLNILYYISFACIYINLFFIYFMDRKSKDYSDLTVRIEGFKNFLETVEKPKLEELVEENPKYFYNILPYTYVLSISKKWIDKFKDIPIPEVDLGNFNYGDSSSYRDMADDVFSLAPSGGSGSSSDGGCSSCGGGCSSCGGGCSSCGGGGSW